MQLSEQHKLERWFFLGQEYEPLRMTRLSELEIMEHSMWIDAICDGPRLTYWQIQQCRQRFINFCNTQFNNRN